MVEDYIDDISFSYYSCLKIFDKIDKQDLKRNKKVFEKYFKRTKNDLLYVILILSNWMYNYNIEYLNKVDFFLNNEKKFINKEQEIIKHFFERVIEINEDKNNYNSEENMEYTKENEEEKIKDEKSFANLFKSKIKYILYKYKIKNGICEEKILEELKGSKDNKINEEKLKEDKEKKINNDKADNKKKSLAFAFKEEKCHLNEIKVYLCIAEWHFEKYKKNNNLDEKNNFYNYLNFAFYVANFYNKENINKYMNYLAETKYIFKKIKKNEDINAYNDIINKIKKLCDLYEYKYADTNIDYYINE